MAVVQYNPYEAGRNQNTATDSSVGGVSSLPAEPAAARVAVRDGRVLLPAAQNGSIIAVSYEARARGVTRFFRGKEAVAHCPEIVLVQVPTAHGKSDMGVYRSFGARALKTIREACGAGVLVEKASVDEMYLDITAPAKALLHDTISLANVFTEALEAGTHVAGAAEAAEEAGRGAQPGGVLARNSFRAGHAGQVERSMDDDSASWWTRMPHDWADEERLLAAGACIVARARALVTSRLGFTCSAGVAANKLLAKLCGGLHKPNQQTVLPPSSVQALLDPLPVDRLRGFGGKLGELLRNGRPDADPPLAGFETAGAMRRAGSAAVARVLRGEWSHAEDQATAACRLACGEDAAPVEERSLPKQVGSSKNFGGNRGSARGPLDTRETIERWTHELAADIASRLIEEADDKYVIALELCGLWAPRLALARLTPNSTYRCHLVCSLREPTMLVAACRFEDDGFAWQAARSKRCAIRSSECSAEKLTKTGMKLINQLASGRPPHRIALTLLSLTAEGFVPTAAAGGGAGTGVLKRMLEGAAAASAAGSEGGEVAQSDAAAGESEATSPYPKRTRPDVESSAAVEARVAAELAAEAAEMAEAVRAVEAAETEAAAAVAQAAEAAQPWSCGACTLLNVAESTRCEMCDCIRGGSLPAAATLADQERWRSNPGRAGAGDARGGCGRSATASSSSSSARPEAGRARGGRQQQQTGMASFLKRP